jgi:hypothetical protein
MTDKRTEKIEVYASLLSSLVKDAAGVEGEQLPPPPWKPFALA